MIILWKKELNGYVQVFIAFPEMNFPKEKRKVYSKTRKRNINLVHFVLLQVMLLYMLNIET